MGLQFKERADGTVDAAGTIGNLRRYLRARRESLDLIQQMALAERPDLFITDFEPLVALAAAAAKTACVSLDNQHLFCQPLESFFPLYLKLYGRLAGAFVRWWIKQSEQNIVTAFHRCPASQIYRSVNSLVRDRLAALMPSDGEHVLIYCREKIGRQITQLVAGMPERFVVYGCCEGAIAENIQYKATSYEGFAADLASCKAVICLAGQQLLGEARILASRCWQFRWRSSTSRM